MATKNEPGNLWGEYDSYTLRFNGRTVFQQVPPEIGTWHKLRMNSIMDFISGDIPWKHLARINLGDPVIIDPSIDLRFLSHVPSQIWKGSNFISSKWTKVPYIPVDVPKIEPDNWDLFWELWDQHRDRIKRDINEPDYWQGVMIYLHPTIDPSNFNFNTTPISDWTKHFPKMFKAIKEAVPFTFIEKIVLWQNVREVDPHFDPDAFVYPWPDSLRVMLHDTNKKPTFYMTKWPTRSVNFNPPPTFEKKHGLFGVKSRDVLKENRLYIDLPKETNTFLLNNGAFLHGADFGSEKIIMAIKGKPNVMKWLKNLDSSYEKYKRDDYDTYFKS